ncbi:UDP-N-acetylmuramoyl-tripeptide--D-alanyl-D-alanine ligase [Paenibacillus campi]|uniref:UDP-N-acetylmuramoyl-tripeptide--D-alanyl-D- alanine ligase n=1 Tax=Paenibacillus campi TaxID=3106031 RepID=UPI002AFEBD0F|nr:UDP-N-acetylmuramoyl-tripeptide--D-alanyl-D-alanine ligase [Paenibacillus sp. SGZ-1014]
MIKTTIGRIAQMCGGQLSGTAESACHGVVIDSRQVYENSLFVPIIGERADGHNFVADVLSRGAAASLWQRDRGAAPEGNIIIVDDTLAALQRLASAYLEQSEATVIGVTGSNGKTTTKDMVDALLRQAYRVHKTQGNFNSHIGLPLTILGMPEQTEMLILEMGMRGRGEIELLSNIARPHAAIITNIGESHLELLGTREQIARAKMEIVSGLRPQGLLVYNGDEPLLHRLLAEPERHSQSMQTIAFGVEPSNDWQVTGVMSRGRSTIFTTNRYPDEAWTLPLPGVHNVTNALAAMAIAVHYGVTIEQMRTGLSELKLSGMRIEQVEGADGVVLLNDAYNASPSSMKAALDVLDGMKDYRRRIAVLGDMLELGADERMYHEQMGAYAAEHTDLLFTYGERGRHIAAAARTQMSPELVYEYTSKSALISALLDTVQQGDVVLFKASRGMRLEEVLQALMPDSISNAEALEE